jgi:Cu(I)/Ag(I) efflux system protein CusF
MTKPSSSGQRPGKDAALKCTHQPLSKESLMKFKASALIAVAALSLGAAAWADNAHHTTAAKGAAAPAAGALTSAEVRKVDAAQGKVTLKHEAITNLDMPPMTMVFRADKPELLKDLKAGDKVRFRAESVAGAMVVTHIEAAQ